MTNRRRYPGSKPFETAQQDIFFGRDRDIADLTKLIELEQSVVLYGKSGLGKSSLIEAGIIPKIDEKGAYEIIKIRFNAYVAEEGGDTPLQKALATLSSGATWLEDKFPKQVSNLWQALKKRQINSERDGYLLIFDQFEELFTYPEAQVADFARQLAEVQYTNIPQHYHDLIDEGFDADDSFLSDDQMRLLHCPIELKILMGIRSDRMSYMNQLKPYLPEILVHTYELKALGTTQASAAIRKPARQTDDFQSEPFDYDDTALENILDYLTKNNTQGIESFQLQIFCEHIEDLVIEHKHQIISPKQIGTQQDVERIFENYYRDKIADFGSPDQQLAARKLIEEGLIFEAEERRLSLYTGQITKEYKVTQALLDQLVDSRLLRAEPSMRGGYTYELSHDTLVAPVLKAKAERVAEEARQEAARIAQQQKDQLAKAQAEAEAEKQRADREERLRRITTLFAVMAGVLFLFASIWWNHARIKTKEAQRQTSIAEDKTENLEAVLDALYFYEDSLALAYDGYKFGFINKKGKVLIDYKYKAALPFDYRGYAKVKKGENDYLVDKEGIEYRWTDDIEELNTTFEAFDYDDELKFEDNNVQQKILKNTQLKVLTLIGGKIQQLSSTIGSLDSLRYLNLSGNKISILPSQIGQLKLLRVLDLGNIIVLEESSSQKTSLMISNDLSSLPVEIGQLSNLEKLELSGNKLTSLPVEVGQLKNLQDLDLRRNKLTLLPIEIGQLTNLEKLELSDNKLTSLPVEIGQLANLQSLDLKYNKLILLPVEIGQLTNLQSLELSGNELTSLPVEIGQLTNLQSLNLNYSKLATLPIEIGQLTNLQSLELRDNKLTLLPAEIGQLTNLQSLELNGNKLTSLPPEIGQLENLQNLKLEGSGLTLLPVEIGQLTNLRSLYLSANDLTSLPVEIGQLRDLQGLYLGGNFNLSKEEQQKIKKLLPNCDIRF